MYKEVIGNATLYLGDCLEILPTLGKVDAVVTDPPYGINEAAGKNRGRSSKAKAKDYGNKPWDKNPPSHWIFEELRSISQFQIIFGGNFFDLPPTSCFLVWDKENTGDFADCELAWTNLKIAVRKIKFRWNGMLQENMKEKEIRVHPTQKPIPVMEWCLSFIPESIQILDPFMGSGTTGVACMNLGRKFIGIELEEEYFEIACNRIREAYKQPSLFEQPKKPEQLNLIETNG